MFKRFPVKIGFIVVAGIACGFLLRSYRKDVSHKTLALKTCCGQFTCHEEYDRIILFQPLQGIIDSNYVMLFHTDGGKQVEIWESPPSPIWDIFLADIDGDRCDELALCLYKTEPRDPQKDNRLHIYQWWDGNVRALWRGTFLSKPFEIIAFGNVTGDQAEELISIERGRKRREKIYLCVYQWNGFGFDLFAETQLSTIPEEMRVADGGNGQIELSFHKSGLQYTVVNRELRKREDHNEQK